MAYPGNSRRIPNFLKASKAKNLRRFMLQKQLRDGKEYHWFDLQYLDSEKKWYVWFIDTVEIDMNTGKIKEGDE